METIDIDVLFQILKDLFDGILEDEIASLLGEKRSFDKQVALIAGSSSLQHDSEWAIKANNIAYRIIQSQKAKERDLAPLTKGVLVLAVGDRVR